ncbi:TM198 protein, partial [Nothocercus julius]|nr:TM198 protein [Nothocercus julius]
PGPATLCALGCVFGVVYSCFGYRCFKAIMFLSGLLLGSGIIFALCYKERVLETQLSVETSAGIALGIGALCGLVTMLLCSVGLFAMGLQLGLLLAMAALVVAEPLVRPQSAWVPVGSALGLALLCALLALHWQKALTVLATAVLGAAALVACADYALEALALMLYVYERLRLAPPRPLCWPAWALLAAWPALSVLGVLLQWKLTADGFSHSDAALRRQQRQLRLLRMRQHKAKRSLAAPEGSYRRKAPGRAGDVLAPVSAAVPGRGGTRGGRDPANPHPPQSHIRSVREQQQECGASTGPGRDGGSPAPLTAPLAAP